MEKSKIDILLDPLHNFMHKENTSGYILFFSVVVAIFWANSPWKERYHHLWEIDLTLAVGPYVLSKSLHHWINDGLMSVFFFVIGLELKREFMSGELSSAKKAALPIVAAIGGMIVPAVIYWAINTGGPGISGWGIPMATDIAFALGLLTLVGNRVPVSVKIFLMALAVVDDLGAVVVIAFFYSSEISMFNLGIGFSFLLLLGLANYLGVRSILFYMIVGISGLWLAFLSSGIHPTIAGVLLAFAIPATRKIDEEIYLNSSRLLLRDFEKEIPDNSTLTTPNQHMIIEKIKKVSQDAETPLQKLESTLHPWVAFLIMPLFALANSGIELHASILTEAFNAVTIGIIVGLIVGKFLGVYLFSRLMVMFKFAVLPESGTWIQMAGVALLAGVGFTMSMFVTELAFVNQQMIEHAKYGIIFASVLSGTLGIVTLKRQKTVV